MDEGQVGARRSGGDPGDLGIPVGRRGGVGLGRKKVVGPGVSERGRERSRAGDRCGRVSGEGGLGCSGAGLLGRLVGSVGWAGRSVGWLGRSALAGPVGLAGAWVLFFLFFFES